MYRQDVYDLASNWKIIIENFNECYHCPIAHPAFSEVIDTDSYSADISHEYYSTYHGPLRNAPQYSVNYATLWPTAMIALSTHPMAMQVLCTYPIDAGHTRETIDYYFAEDATDEQIHNTRSSATWCSARMSSYANRCSAASRRESSSMAR